MSEKTPTPEVTKSIPGVTVVAWRDAMGFTQRDAAEALGCSRQALLNWEKETTDCPLYIGLAMSALSMGMSAFGVEEKEGK